MGLNAGTHAPASFKKVAASASTAMQSIGSVFGAKLDPHNRVGGEGVDLYSGNYNFTLSLVNLPGRNGMDLNIPLNLNSLVWIKYDISGTKMYFEPDFYQSLTAGFRIGLPELQGPYQLNNVNTYILYLPSGRRVELREVAPNTYNFEAIDSSYFYLVVDSGDPSKKTLYSTDGTQCKFEKPNLYSDPRCTQITAVFK